MSGAELERKRREYIDAAMRMSQRAASEPERETEDLAAENGAAFLGQAERAEELSAPMGDWTEPAADSEPSGEGSEIIAAPELLHEPEPLAENSQKEEEKKEETSFGVFDVGELIEAVKKGELDGEKLREASEILEEMSGKTEEMQRLAQHSDAADGAEPKSLNQSVRRHNGGSCPHCGQGNRNGPRR